MVNPGTANWFADGRHWGFFCFDNVEIANGKALPINPDL
jgi:hypothetical protein